MRARDQVVNRAPSGPLLHNRQVVIAPEPLKAREDWQVVELRPGVWVSYCPSLRAETVRDLDGTLWMVCGAALQTVPEAPDPLEGIARSHTADVPNLGVSWAGRWLLVNDARIHLDPGGLLGCFYARDADGRTWASSSPALLIRATSPDTPVATTSELPPDGDVGVAWYPPPRARRDFVRRLLPTQVLDLSSGDLLPRQPLPEIQPGMDYEATLELLGASLVEAIRRLGRDRQIAVSLSAGLDSRVVLAATERAGVPYTLFTRISTRMSPADRLLPPRLAAALGRELVVQRRGLRSGRRSSRERLPLVMEHCDSHVSEGDAHPLLEGVRDSLGGTLLGGWAFDVGKATLRDKLPASFADPQDGARILARAHLEQSLGIATGFEEWLAWVQRTPQKHLDWRDRFYLEQRLAGWQSAKEQVYDMQALERMPIVNSGRIYAAMLGIDEPTRISRQHQRDLVERLCPRLARFPGNPAARDLGLHRVIAAKLRDDPVGLARIGLARGGELAGRLAGRKRK